MRTACGPALVSAIAGRRPLVVTWHNMVLAPAGPRRRVLAVGEMTVARAATVTLAASADLAARVRSSAAGTCGTRRLPRRCREVHRTVEQVRGALGLEPDRPLVVSVGRLHPQKGTRRLIDAAARWTGARGAGRHRR